MRTLERTVDDGVEFIAVVSDLHGYLEPLLAFDRLRAKWPRHQIVVNGDLCMGGPQPAEVVAWVQQNATGFVACGNHDLGLLKGDDGDQPAFTEGGSYQRLSEEQRGFMRGFPEQLLVHWRGHVIRFVHGHMQPNGEISGCRSTPHQLMERFGTRDAGLTCLGHTHFPFFMERDGCRIANSGATGNIILRYINKDGAEHRMNGGDFAFPDTDWRSSFLKLSSDGKRLNVEIPRFDYDRRKTLEKLAAAGVPSVRLYERKLLEGVVDQREVSTDFLLARPWR